MNRLVFKIMQKIYYRYPEFISRNFKVLFSKCIYFSYTGNHLDLHNPRNINEKTMWLKLYYKNPLIAKCTDKFLVREYVEEKGLSEILNELYGVYNSVDEIDFNKLPDQFALKATHGCGYNIICNNKKNLNIEESRKKLKLWLNSVYGIKSGEWHYSEIVPKIICEKYLDHTENWTSIADYKIHCINGKPYCIMNYYNRTEHSKMRTSYNLNWERINILKNEADDCEKPQSLDSMINIAKILAEPFPYVRVDFYEINGQLYFGELTFTPLGGMQTIFTDEALNLMGKELVLPKKNKIQIPFLS